MSRRDKPLSDYLGWLFISTRGRISRATYWGASLALLSLFVLLAVALSNVALRTRVGDCCFLSSWRFFSLVFVSTSSVSTTSTCRVCGSSCALCLTWVPYSVWPCLDAKKVLPDRTATEKIPCVLNQQSKR
jgi:uncharacterized membrane protein YhaH (DUF805 family)